MRLRTLAILPVLAASAVIHAAALPVGLYSISGVPGTGIHLSPDTGTLSGTLLFNAASILTSANITFHDTTVGHDYTFTQVGPTGFDSSFPATEFALISNSVNPSFTYAFSIATAGLPGGAYKLTCGVDCDTDAYFNNGIADIGEELVGSIAPVPTPEPASFVLLATGVLGLVGTARRHLAV